jgi:hypothetical protein
MPVILVPFVQHCNREKGDYVRWHGSRINAAPSISCSRKAGIRQVKQLFPGPSSNIIVVQSYYHTGGRKKVREGCSAASCATPFSWHYYHCLWKSELRLMSVSGERFDLDPLFSLFTL